MLSFGAGAHTHYFGGHNWTNVYPITEYMGTLRKGLSPIVMAAKVSEQELMAKYMVLGVRAIGVDKEQFKTLFGTEIQNVFPKEIAYLTDLGWIIDNETEYQLTRDGIYYVDNISKFFYTEANARESQPRGKQLYKFIPENFYGRQK